MNESKESEESIKEKLNKAIDSLVREDFKLFTLDVNERSICHRLALYLEPYFPGWNIDCEYNRDRSTSKKLKSLAYRMDIALIKIDETDGPTVFPDIIVHRRGNNDNLLVIEMKKTSYGNEREEFDRCKLVAFKTDLNYQFTALVKIRTGNKCDLENRRNNVRIFWSPECQSL